MKLVYSPRYHLDLGNHVWPVDKYRLVHSALIAQGLAAKDDFIEPEPASWTDLALAHTDEYLEKVRFGRLSPAELAQLELPLSPALVEGFRLMTGGTITAARLLAEDVRRCRLAQEALKQGGGSAQRESLVGAKWTVVVHLGGGFHHAFANHGEGFCLFNDVAVSICLLKQLGHISRAAVVDLDVHHGNGTAMLFERDPSVFTFSMHQQHNYPLFKPQGSLDIGLADGTGDEAYLTMLRGALPKVLASAPDMIFYLAGADPFRGDQLGGLNLTLEGLRRRDWLVFKAAREASVPVVVTLAGGYAERIEDTVAIHTATIAEAKRVVEER